MTRKTQPTIKTIENCIPLKITSTKKQHKIKYPEKKQFNLLDPKFREKGLKKEKSKQNICLEDTKPKKEKHIKKNKKKIKKTKKQENEKKQKKRKSNRRSIKKVRNDKCAPRNKNDILDFTCYTPNSLHKIKNIWNKKHPDSKITSNNPKTIWENLTYIFKNVCHKESCWLSHKCLTESLP